MTKILDINNMLDAAENSKLPRFKEHLAALEAVAALLANDLAQHLDIVTEPGGYEQGCGGLCCNFYAKHEGQPCPEVIDEGDVGGDWETKS